MRLKQKPRAFKIILIVFLLTSFSCIHRNEDEGRSLPDSHQYDDEWGKGRRLYLDNCGACHLGVRKDSIFMDFNFANKAIKKSSKEMRLKSILTDSNHISLGPEILGNEQIELLIKYVETPQRRGTVINCK